MGSLTRGELITEAALKAGKEPASIQARARTYLNVRLRSLYKGWPFSFLQRRLEGLALGVGAGAVSVGAGAGGVTEEIKLIRSPILVYTADYSARGRALVQSVHGDFPTTGINTVTARGMPGLFYVRANATTYGRWDIAGDFTPDRNYVLAIDYIVQPADLTDDNQKPIYPNDRTLLAGLQADILSFMHGPSDADAQAAEEEFSALAQRDRAEYGSVPGTNDNLGLDPSVFG